MTDRLIPTRILVAFFLLSLIVRVAYIQHSGINSFPTSGDGGTYIAASNSILKGSYPLQLPFTRPPFFPLLIAAMSIFGSYQLAAVRLFQALLDSVSCFLFMAIARKLFDRRAAIIAGLTYALSLYFIYDTAQIQTETLYQFLVIAAAFFYIDSAKVSNYFWAGILFGFSALTRPQSLLLIVCLTGFSVFFNKQWKTALFLILGSALVIGPWTIRNAVRYHEFLPVTDGGGYAFWLSNNRMLLDRFETKDYSDFVKIDRKMYLEESARLWKPVIGKAPGQADAYWFQQGKDAIRDLGTDYFKLVAYKIGVYFRPMLSPQAYGWKLSLLTLFFPGILLIVGFFVFIRSVFKGDKSSLQAYALSCFITGFFIAVVFQSQVRLRVPLLDPCLILYGASAVSGWISSRKKEELLR